MKNKRTVLFLTGINVMENLCLMRSVALGSLTGFVKLMADRRSKKLLGGVIVAYHISKMIGQIAVALRMGATVDDLRMLHPTFFEAFQEAAWRGE